MCIVYYTRSPLDGNPREAREDAASRANVFRAGGIAASGYGDETLFVARPHAVPFVRCAGSPVWERPLLLFAVRRGLSKRWRDGHARLGREPSC